MRYGRCGRESKNRFPAVFFVLKCKFFVNLIKSPLRNVDGDTRWETPSVITAIVSGMIKAMLSILTLCGLDYGSSTYAFLILFSDTSFYFMPAYLKNASAFHTFLFQSRHYVSLCGYKQ